MMSKEFLARRAGMWSVDIEDVEGRKKIIETIEYNSSNKIHLFEFKGSWGYCLHIWPQPYDRGIFYGPLLAFCDPFPDRLAALEGAAEELTKCYGRSEYTETKKVLKWAQSLLAPRQLRMEI
jgi:hypothetical protein